LVKLLPPTAKVRIKGRKAITQRARQRIFRPYEQAIGHVSVEWNRLQEHLGIIFARMFLTVSIVPRAIWHSTQSDRAQREMLRAALDAAAVEHLFGRNQAVEDIKWLLNEAHKLAERRNNALHAPYVIIADDQGTRFAPMDFSGNPRAAKLVKKDLLIEFAWYADCARVLSDYAFAVQYALALPHQPWPGRPALPVLQQKKSRPNPQPRQP
jgi:hypothetical protein